jgi:hypothetical protein
LNVQRLAVDAGFRIKVRSGDHNIMLRAFAVLREKTHFQA